MRPPAAAAEGGLDSQERILHAALEAFAGNGFEGARMRDIAARADVPLGLLQYHFGGKQKLWRAAVDRAFAELHGGLERALSDPSLPDDRERLRRVVRDHAAYVAQHPEFVRLMHDEGKRRGPRMRWMVDRHVKPLFDALAPVIERAQADGLLPGGIAAAHFTYVLVGAVGVIFHQSEECKRVAGFDPSDPAEVEAHTRAVEHLLLGPPPEEGSA